MKGKWLISVSIIVSLLLVLGSTSVSASDRNIREATPPNSAGEYVPNQIIVKYKGDTQPFRVINVPEGKVSGKIHEYLKMANVEYAEPNYYAYALWQPNDEYYPYQWHLDKPEYGGIGMEEAWNISSGLGVTVAIVDTGVAYEYYQEGRWRKYEQAPDLANTGFVAGYDFINDDAHPNDDSSPGHGTHVAGTVAQSTDNSMGVAGVAFSAQLMPVKVLDSRGAGTYADVAGGIRYAVDHGAQVINLSLGGSTPSATIEEAVAYAYDEGVTVIAAAGNDGSDTISYPAAYDNYVIAVGATQYDKNLAPYSNYGASLDLVAPGGNLNFDQNDDDYGDGVLQQTYEKSVWGRISWGYYFMQGTSMAAPHVSGIAALLLAHGNATTPDDVRAALQDSAEDLGTTGRDDTYGWGLVDAYAALQWTAGNPPIADANGSYSGNEGSEIAFDGSASSDSDGSIVSYEWDFGDGTTGTGTTPSHAYVDNGSYTTTLTVTDNDGLTGTDIASVTVDNVPPIASATNDGPKDEGTPITVTASQTDPGILDTFTCSFDWNNDGTYEIVDQTSHSFSHTWAQDGAYTVGVRVKDKDAGEGTTTTNVIVNDIDPIADFSYSPASPTAGDTIEFTDQSTSYDGISSWAWDFETDDSTAQNPTHAYSSDGIYTASLTVEEADGDSSTASKNITVSAANEPPVADAGDAYSGDEYSAITFDASGSSDPDGTIATYEWDWESDETYDETTASPTINHTWNDDYTGTVTLRVTDDWGKTDISTASVQVNNVPPTLTGTADQSGDEGSAITFTAGTVSDPGADSFEYRWDFNSNGTYDTVWSSSNTASNTWNDDYTGIVTVEVRDDDGGTDTDTCSVTVNNVVPSADAGGPYSGTVNEVITFAGNASDPGADTLTYEWDFEYDGETFTTDVSGVDLKNPSHTYTAVGDYTVGLRVKDEAGGISAIATAPVNVNPAAPTAYVNIELSKQTVWRWWRVMTEVIITDASGLAIADATVEATWSGASGGTVSGTTDEYGVVSFRTGFIRGSGTVTFTVSKVVKDGQEYILAGETSESITN